MEKFEKIGKIFYNIHHIILYNKVMHFTSVFLNIYKRVVQLSMMGDTFLKKIVSLLTFFVKVDGSFFRFTLSQLQCRNIIRVFRHE